jgi:hypothetical protein
LAGQGENENELPGLAAQTENTHDGEIQLEGQEGVGDYANDLLSSGFDSVGAGGRIGGVAEGVEDEYPPGANSGSYTDIVRGLGYNARLDHHRPQLEQSSIGIRTAVSHDNTCAGERGDAHPAGYDGGGIGDDGAGLGVAVDGGLRIADELPQPIALDAESEPFDELPPEQDSIAPAIAPSYDNWSELWRLERNGYDTNGERNFRSPLVS